MSARDAPAFDFYPERWIVGTAAMSDAEQLSYLRLLCHQWTMDGLPEDEATLRRLGGKGVTGAVVAKFPVSEGKRRNARLEIIRLEQRARIAKSRDKIKKMNEARASTRTPTRGTTRPLLSDFLAASSPPTTHPVLLEKEPKTTSLGKASKFEDVSEYAKTMGYPETAAVDFWDKMQAGGWKRGKESVKDWQAHFRTMQRNGWLASGESAKQAPKSFAQIDRDDKEAARHGAVTINAKILTLEG